MNAHQVIKYILPEFIIRRLEGRKNFQKIITNTGWLFFDKILRMGIGLFVWAWIARYLGPEQFGILNFATAFVALFGAFATLGLDGIVVRDIVKDPLRKEKILGSAFVLKLIGGTFTLVLTVSLISFIRVDDTLMKWLVGITAAGFVFQAFDIIDFYFQSQVQSKYTVYGKNSAFIIVSIVKIILLLNKASLIAFAWAGFAEIVLGSLFMIIAYRINKHYIGEWQASSQVMKGLLRDSWPLVFSGLVIAIYMKIDQIMIGNLIGDKAVGNYSVAVRISEVWYFVPMAITSSVFPAIINSKKISEKLYYDKLQRLYDLMVWMAVSIALPMTFLSDLVINSFFGIKYTEAGSVLSIHIWTSVFVFLGVASGGWLLAENMQKFAFYRTSAGCIVNVGLNYMLIPKYGINGAAIATLISQMIASYIGYMTSHKTFLVFKMLSLSFLLPVRILIKKFYV